MPHKITDRRVLRVIARTHYGWKRTLDVLAAVVCLVLLAPALVTIALVLCVASGRFPLVGQERVGRFGKRFRHWSFVTENRNNRHSAWGYFLEETGLARLPALWNVLVGDMSIIGPKPIPRPDLDHYGPERRYYLVMRPGLTGLWRVQSRADGSIAQRAEADRDYVEGWSLARDAAILARSLPRLLASGDRTI
jgi:lipopolysaccharide/colanic/teichoic acid biosynthesis glycosyltransferase